MSSGRFTLLDVPQMIADLEEEKRRRAQDSAHDDDAICMLQTERDKLLQQVCAKHVKEKVKEV